MAPQQCWQHFAPRKRSSAEISSRLASRNASGKPYYLMAKTHLPDALPALDIQPVAETRGYLLHRTLIETECRPRFAVSPQLQYLQQWVGLPPSCLPE